jgi:hypothetical protein
LLFEEIPSTKDICAYGDEEVRGQEWRICPWHFEGFYGKAKKAFLGFGWRRRNE